LNTAEEDYNPQHVHDLFNRMSGSYERVNYITSFGFSLRWRRQFLQELPPSSAPLEVIDLMTGMGETWSTVKKHYPHATLSALDFSEGMLSHAHRRNKNSFRNSVTVVQQNLLENNLAGNHYDVVLSAFGLKTFNAEQLHILAQETKRILKPGGRFSMIEVSSPRNVVLRGLYKLHLKYLVPFCGRLFPGNPSEYRMLWKYTERFRNADEAAAIFSAAGLQVQKSRYFYGCATGITGRKA
jgi:ubiquinone/menaquinone biosynthesis methyltransferase